MARAEAVTQDAVFTACQELVATEVKPTLEAVRAKTGGSYNTLSPLLKAWRGQQAAQAAAVIEMPEQVVGAVKGLAAELWKLASSEAAARTRAIEEAAEARANDAETEAAELSQALQGVETALTAANNKIDGQAQALAEAVASLEAVRRKAANSEAQAQAMRESLERAEARNDQLQGELVAMAKDFAASVEHKPSKD